MGRLCVPARTVSAAVRAALVVSIVTGLSLAGCGVPGTGEEVLSGTASPSPTAACPRVEDIAGGQRNCAVYDPDAAMAENEGYRRQRPVSADAQAQLDSYVGPARTALESLRPPATVADVKRALGSVGLDAREVQTDDVGTGIRFGAGSSKGGCVTGNVSLDGTVYVSTGGSIMDGGCLAMSGH